jgi:hypothetical protein
MAKWKRWKRLLAVVAGTVAVAAVISVVIYLQYGVGPGYLFVRLYEYKRCQKCGLKTRDEKRQVLHSAWRYSSTELGRDLVYTIFEEPKNCVHVFRMSGQGVMAFNLTDFKFTRSSTGGIDPFYESTVLRDALAAINQTNSSMALEILARLDRLHYNFGTAPSVPLQRALSGTDSTNLAKVLVAEFGY